MTWNRIIDTIEGGNGALEYRLQIEGFDYSFVTDQEMASLTTLPKRINGLKRKGIKINQAVQFSEAKLRLDGNTFTVVDFQEKATEAFYRKPTYSSRIVSNASKTDSIIYVENINGLTTGTYLYIGSEVVLVNGIIAGSQNQLLVTRGQLGTTAQAHYVITQFNEPIRPTIQNVPFTIENKRAYLYAYGLGDDLAGPGTLIWRGFVLKDVVNNGMNYTIETGPITEVLKYEIGIDDGTDLKIRGINLGSYQWVIQITEWGCAANVYLPTSVTNVNTIAIEGFFETVNDLAADINTKANALTSGWNTKVGCTVSSTGELLFTINHGSVNNMITFNVINNPGASNPFADVFDFEVENTAKEYLYTGNIVTNSASKNFTTTKTYAVRLKPKTTFPVPFMLYSSEHTEIDTVSPASQAFGRRFYLANYTPSAILDTIQLEGSDGKAIAQSISRDATAFAISTTDNYVECILSFNMETPRIVPFDPNASKIILGTSFGAYKNGNDTYNLIDFLEYLIENSPDYCNFGLIPVLTNGDFDFEDMQLIFNEIGLTSFLNNRTYSLYKKSSKLEEILAEELKLLGCFFALTDEGKITIRRLRNVNPYETPDYTIDSDDILTDTDYIRIQKNEFGIFNAVSIATGYNGTTQKWEGKSFVFTNTDSISQFNKQKQINIKPYFKPQGVPGTLGISELEDLKQTVLKAISLFSKNYEVYEIELPMKYFNINIGSTIRIKNKQVPNWGTPGTNPDYVTTRRGSARILGTVVSKDFDMEQGFGKIKVMISDQEYAFSDLDVKAIFAPDFLTSTVTNLGANLYRVVVDSSSVALVMPSGLTLSNFISVYDGLRFDQFNSSTHNSGQGKIVQITGTGNALTLIVDFNNGGTVPSNFTTQQFFCKIPNYDSIFTTDSQKIYGFFDSGYLGPANENYPSNILSRILAF